MSFTLLLPPLLLMGCVLALLFAPTIEWRLPALLAVVAANAASFLFWAKRYRTWYRLSPATALLAPVGWLLYLFIVVQGTFKSLFKRGVEWKGRVYS